MLNEIKMSAWAMYASMLHLLAIVGGIVLWKFFTNPVELARMTLKLAATPIWPW